MDRYEDAYNQYRQQEAAEGQINSEIDDGKEFIEAVRKNDDGNIIAVKTNTGRELDYPSALSEAKDGRLAHVDVFHKYGRDILRSEPDGIKENNLDELPHF